MKASKGKSDDVWGGWACTTADWLVDQIKSVSMAVILSSCNAASNSFLEQTEWAQRCLLETSRAGFGETLADRGDRVSRPTTRAAIGEMLRGGGGFFWDQSRWWRVVAVARASGLRVGASGCIGCCIGLRSILAAISR